MAPVIFVNIGWMKYYDGPSDNDPLNPGNFGYFKQEANRGRAPIGHESWNFHEQAGTMYGYIPREPGLDLTRLGADRNADHVDGVLVVFMARDPLEKVLKVVGWYRDASVHRSPKFMRRYGRIQVGAMITARANRCHRLPVANRSLTIPTARKTEGGVGQSPVWYAARHPEIVREVWALVEGHAKQRNHRRSSGGAPRNPDTEARLAVERQAMEMAMKYFDDTVDVSLRRLGWDVEAGADDGRIYIEVKGISGSEIAFELTPNEYEKMREHRERYLLFVVTSALSAHPRTHIFRCRIDAHGEPVWVSELDERLQVQPRTGARCCLE